jgi:hypothetical protein
MLGRKIIKRPPEGGSQISYLIWIAELFSSRALTRWFSHIPTGVLTAQEASLNREGYAEKVTLAPNELAITSGSEAVKG